MHLGFEAGWSNGESKVEPGRRATATNSAERPQSER